MITTLDAVKAQLLPTVPTATEEAQINVRIETVTAGLHRYLNQKYRDIGDIPYKYCNRPSWYHNLDLNGYISFSDGSAVFSGATVTIDSEPKNWQAGDSLEIYNSLRNDGWYTIENITGTGPYVITVDRDFKDEDVGRTVYFFYIDYPQGLQEIANSMVIYDVFQRPKTGGIQSERIGTYSYTLGDIGGSGYPNGLTSGLINYKKPRVIQ